MQVETVCMLGGTGFVGRAAAEHLCERGVRVRVITRRMTKSRALWVLPTLEIAVCDPHDEVALATQFDGVDAVVNLCGILHQTARQSYEAVHVDLPRKIVGACRAAGVRHLIHMSALGTSETGPSEYLRSKARGEAAVRETATNLPCTILRPSVIFGEHDDFLNRFAMLVSFLPFVPLASAGTRFAPIWVEDVARAIAAALGNSRVFNRSLDLCGPRAYTVRELVELVAQTTGRNRAIFPIPDWAANLQAAVLERLPGKLLTRENLRSMKVDYVCDGPFPEALGFTPAPLEAVAPEYLAGRNARARYNVFRYRAGR
jgi:NADH dehydrogenase